MGIAVAVTLEKKKILPHVDMTRREEKTKSSKPKANTITTPQDSVNRTEP
jgi:hypothetical protein